MKPTTEGSNTINFDMVCMSFGKEKERGLKVVQGATKNSIFNEEVEIKAEDSKMREDNTIETANGKIIKFKERTFEKIKVNRKLKAEKGIVLNFEENVKEKNKNIQDYGKIKARRTSRVEKGTR